MTLEEARKEAAEAKVTLDELLGDSALLEEALFALEAADVALSGRVPDADPTLRRIRSIIARGRTP